MSSNNPQDPSADNLSDFEHQPNQDFAYGSPTDEEIRLQALNHTKDKLLSVVGHDLRSAIGGVVSIVYMLDKRLEQGDMEDAKRLSGLIRRAALDADDLLKDLVTWTRNSGQELNFRLESMDVVELVETEIARLQSVAMRKKQRIRLEAYDSGMIRADSNMLQAIFRNLLTNALKFSDHESDVTVRIYRQPGLWEFQVCDKGIGMSAEVQDVLLKIDKRKQKPGTSGETGSGFGLLLCEDFIQRHGGHLTWESALGRGTTFSFTIPELLG
ncbi:MAG: HAMP domain-containing histidine kinase [Opitutales bacterium]|jgi:two-component system, sensor histidine kinase and response regulator|nr:HAMP domain-containing histidine kinase [Opitutales bacterium]MDP4642863.1 HAMP domain-containing histidine kinase [Opitutales bacterium]MDP4776551.1 HAMP domain-containing histidine kinase [Opitutales bacterium]MDP4878805.1 HAMP domain-containing histidine kinase [Opitutales bacterium]MDP4882712.1 HAMP domain-containing histidine kinase [Opitutales bacterium]